MPNVKGKESTSPPDGGNVEEHYENIPLTSSHGFTETSVVNTSSNQTLIGSDDKKSHATLLPDGSPFKTEWDKIDKEMNGGQLDPSKRNVIEEVTNICSREGTSQIDRERAIKELGITSTSFIGPACRPEPSIEQELCDFYKELEEADSSDKVDGDTTNEQCHHLSYNPKSDPPNRKDIPADVTDHSRAYRPYPDPHERSGHQWKYEDPKRWRPRPQYGTDGFGRGGHFQNWYPPPPWIPHGPPDSRSQYFTPPGPIYPPDLRPQHPGGPMYPPEIRPQHSFYSQTNNSTRAPWEEPQLPSNEWHGYGRAFSSHGYPGFFGEYETPSNWQRQNPEQQYNYEEGQNEHYNNNSLVLILLRGVPGSGKSTLARELLSTGPNGMILSTDDYFFQENRYVFDPTLLGDAHDWNQKRAERAMLEGRSPIIIDNTNVKAWEMKPYVEMASEHRYRVDFLEPDTHWKYDPAQLEKRNKHGVPQETIAKMLDRFERPMNVDIVMNSVEPPHKCKGN
ncbi:NEDD4-binding protein 2-like 2 [Myxocyprinus asiaticus]|uniref:NEDD4-binding protein 2-like 2 n=1 Tax=Myxocyprinus asiaticus TaxID=70543 RepID=UPI002221DA32|nr:NEDD4-binding protein 2-like 2 [Myxocyprinus asiaticus]